MNEVSILRFRSNGLDQNDYIIEFGMIPFDTETKTLEENLARTFTVHCPSFETLKASAGTMGHRAQ